jgi:hypothetical protein
MKNIFFALLCFGATQVEAQVKFKLQLLQDEKTYQVSIIPETTWAAPFNITSTAQVTLVMPEGSFEPKNVKSLQPGADFAFNSIANTPTDNATADYYSVGLSSLGTQKIAYKAGQEIPLFTFQNALPCSGSIALLDHKSDVFYKNPKKKANIGNYLSVYGAAGDAYQGNIGTGVVPCADARSVETGFQVSEIGITPNPFTTDLQFSAIYSVTDVAAVVEVVDALGVLAYTHAFEATAGRNTFQMPLADLSTGMYTVTVKSSERILYTTKLVKVDY